MLGQAERVGLLSKEHFSVDGTLIEALASLKSFRPKDEDGPPRGGGRNPTVNFHGEKRSRDTYESKTDPDALLFKKSKGTAAELVEALGGTRRITLGTDKNYDTQGFVAEMREMNVTPHVAQNDTNRSSAIDGRTTSHPGYGLSQIKRKRIEECFGWLKTVGGLRKSRFVGREKLDFQFVLTFAAFNLIRMRNLGGGWCRVDACRSQGLVSPKSRFDAKIRGIRSLGPENCRRSLLVWIDKLAIRGYFNSLLKLSALRVCPLSLLSLLSLFLLSDNCH